MEVTMSILSLISLFVNAIIVVELFVLMIKIISSNNKDDKYYQLLQKIDRMQDREAVRQMDSIKLLKELNDILADDLNEENEETEEK